MKMKGCIKAYSIEELKDEIYTNYPGVEEHITNTFNAHDIVGDGLLPFGVVEALLRDYFTKYGLVEYVYRMLTPSGKLSLSTISPYLEGTHLSDVDDDTMVTCEDMKILATLWLKNISEAYKSDELKIPNNSFAYVVKPVVQGVDGGNSALKVERNNLIVDGVSGVEQLTLAEVKENDVEIAEMSPQEIVDSYVTSILDEVEKNKTNGIVCYAYPAAIAPNGACTSAGAVIPQRRPRAKRDKQSKRPLLGCC